MASAQNVSLYDRLGGFEGITRITHEVIDAHRRNPLIAPRFQDLEDLDHTRKVVAEFFCAGCGGPEQYTGRDLLAAHKGMNISEQEFMAAVDDVLRAMQKNDVDTATRAEVTAILYSMKEQVVRV